MDMKLQNGLVPITIIEN